MSTNAPEVIAPQNHADAAKVAEQVTVDELLDMFEASSSVTILERNTPRRHAFCDRPRTTLSGQTVVGTYEYISSRTGYGKVGTFVANGFSPDPVFDFYNLGRVVRLADRAVGS